MIWPQKSADILLVEDDATIVELAMQAFRERNISRHVIRVVDGNAALDFIAYLELLAAGNGFALPRVILLDLHLRTASGIEILEQIKFNERTCQIPVVVFTGSPGGIELMACYRLGVNSCIKKSADREKFRQIIGDIGHYWINVNQLPV
jgi:two-component system response regulator